MLDRFIRGEVERISEAPVPVVRVLSESTSQAAQPTPFTMFVHSAGESPPAVSLARTMAAGV
jgi:bifunctional ADP-heptose synthase (sugar kinase/adenylyltransferase)